MRRPIEQILISIGFVVMGLAITFTSTVLSETGVSETGIMDIRVGASNQWCNWTNYCNPPLVPTCATYSKEMCLGKWEIQNVNGLRHWGCVNNGDWNCRAYDRKTCRKDYDCEIVTLGCAARWASAEGYEATTDCEES